jgi:hypothetical protein
MAKVKATKGDSKGKPLETVSNNSNAPDLLSIELPKLEVDVAEAVCGEVLRGLYVETLKEYGNKQKTIDEKDKETMLELLKSFETIICWLDQSDKWLKDLFADSEENEKKARKEIMAGNFKAFDKDGNEIKPIETEVKKGDI